MQPLTDENIESELSYAYLHAVAAHAGIACGYSNRHLDNAGVDAHLTSWGPFTNTYKTEVDLNVQLKATISPPAEVGDYLSYNLKGIERYDALREPTVSIPRILVVLFLPREKQHWLSHAEEALTLKRCAYWVSLRNAPASTNATAQTVYLPKSQRFDPTGIGALFNSIARGAIPTYQLPR